MEKYFHFDRNKSLQELDGEVWEYPSFDSHILVTCYQLRKKPVGMFTTEELRVMIGQGFNLEYLIPLALEELEDNILFEGDFYPGDLLESVLRVKKEFWEKNLGYKDELEEIISKNIEKLKAKLKKFKEEFK